MSAWPALESMENDGWVLRFSEGYTRRANSVHPLEQGRRELPAKIEEAEGLYAARGLPTIFKMTAQSLPPGLEEALVERGYEEEARTAVCVAELAPGRRGASLETKWERARAWSDGFHRASGAVPGRRALHDRILASISLPTGFVSVAEDGEAVAFGVGVLQGEWLGDFDVIVERAARRRGHGERLMRGLIAWGFEMGARRAYLQVMLDNAPALALYEKLGFREAYRYWYRVQPTAAAPRSREAAEKELDGGDLGFSYHAAKTGVVAIQRGGRTVTELRHDAARRFLADVDGASPEEEQELMARYTGNYRRGNERVARQHPRHRR